MRIRARRRSCFTVCGLYSTAGLCARSQRRVGWPTRRGKLSPPLVNALLLCAFTLVGGPGAHVRSVERSTRSHTGQCTCNCSRKALARPHRSYAPSSGNGGGVAGDGGGVRRLPHRGPGAAGRSRQPRRRLISKAAMEAATATFSDSTWLRIGIRSWASVKVVDPWVSPPSTSTARGARSA